MTISLIKHPTRVIYFLVSAAFFGILLLFFLTLITIADIGYRNRVFANTYLANTDVSGFSPAQLEQAVTNAISDYSKTKINITLSGNRFQMPLDSLGITYDEAGTAGDVYGLGRKQGFWNDNFYRIKSLFVQNKIKPIYSVDYQVLVNALTSKYHSLEKPPASANIIFKDRSYQIIGGGDGQVVDNSQLYLLLRERLDNLSNSDIDLELVDERPLLTTDSLKKALEKVKNLDKQNISLTFEGQAWNLSGDDLTNLLRLYPMGYGADYLASVKLDHYPIIVNQILTAGAEAPVADISLDSQKLDEFISQIAQAVDRPTVDATLKFEGGKVSQFRPAEDGLSLNQVRTAQLILNKVSVGNPSIEKNIVIDLPVSVTHAKIANEQINSMGIKELVGRGISYFYHSIPNRVFNVGLGASRLSGTLVAPGDTFSFDNAVGEVSGATGYKQAYVISAGRTVLDDGGGICQVSTTLFRAVLNAGLPVISRTAHAYRVGYYEEGGFDPGFDATVWSPSVDFKFKNDTDHYLLVQSIMDADNMKLEIDIYGTRDDRKVELSKATITNVTPAPPDKMQDDPTLPKGTIKQVDFAAAGANVVFYRKVYRGGNLVIDETFKSNYRPWQAVFLVGTQ